MTKVIWTGGLALLAACSSAPVPVAPAPVVKTLGYAMPASATASYAFSDTSSFDIEAGAAGNIHVSIDNAGIADMTFASDSGLQATVHLSKLNASTTNSQMGASPAVTESEVQGDAVVRISARGAPTIVSMPKVTAAAGTAGISESFYRHLFVRLPASGVRPGQTWVDTVSTTDENQGTKAVVKDVVASTFVGDTMVNGRTLAHVVISTQRTLDLSGQNQSVHFVQKLSGTTTGYALWDMERNLLVERDERTTLKGTFDLPDMGMTGLPVSATASGRMTLR
jgi:hypothetical protein